MKEFVTYLNFDGKAREAMTFYKDCLGGELALITFGEAPGDFPKEARERIMHSRITLGGVPVLMASDTMPGMPFHPGNNFSVSVSFENEEEIRKVFAAFSEDATIRMPLQKTFWAPLFGMLTDKFGISWLFNFETAHPS